MSEQEHLTPVTEVEDPDPRAFSTFVVGVVGCLLTLVVFIGLEVIYYKTDAAEFRRKEIERVPAELTAVGEEQHKMLEGYRWVDKDTQVVGLPIDRAMELVVEEHGKP